MTDNPEIAAIINRHEAGEPLSVDDIDVLVDAVLESLRPRLPIREALKERDRLLYELAMAECPPRGTETMWGPAKSISLMIDGYLKLWPHLPKTRCPHPDGTPKARM